MTEPRATAMFPSMTPPYAAYTAYAACTAYAAYTAYAFYILHAMKHKAHHPGSPPGNRACWGIMKNDEVPFFPRNTPDSFYVSLDILQ